MCHFFLPGEVSKRETELKDILTTLLNSVNSYETDETYFFKFYREWSYLVRNRVTFNKTYGSHQRPLINPRGDGLL